jgi:hypothetical protein
MFHIHIHMIRKLKSGEYRLYSRKKSESTGKRRNLGTFTTLQKARQHEREVQFFKKHWGSGATHNLMPSQPAKKCDSGYAAKSRT